MMLKTELLRCRRCGCLVRDEGPDSRMCSSCGSVVVLPLTEVEETTLFHWARAEMAIG